MRPVKIGNGQGFWGDDEDAPIRLVKQQPDLDYLTLDYLAELSLSIMATQRQKDPSAGYARDFLSVVQRMIPLWKEGSTVKIVTNAGGLAPRRCGEAVHAILREAGLPAIRVGVVDGDDVLDQLVEGPTRDLYRHLEEGTALTEVADQLLFANAYIGAEGIVRALRQGAQIVVTGRVADPSLTVGPALYHFGWRLDAYDKIAGATVAGHLIECGAQMTGGFSTNWLDLPDPATIGFPVVEIQEEGWCIATKPEGTGGAVTSETVKEQLLYEIGDPSHYLSPDAIVSFADLSVIDMGNNRVSVRGAVGSPPPPHYKVNAAHANGYRAEGMVTIFGDKAEEKAKRCGKLVLDRLAHAGSFPKQSLIEVLGAGACAPGLLPSPHLFEVVLRIAVADLSYELVHRFTKAIAPLVTSGPQGVTGYASGRPKVRPVVAYWPCLIERDRLAIQSSLIEEGLQ